MIDDLHDGNFYISIPFTYLYIIQINFQKIIINKQIATISTILLTLFASQTFYLSQNKLTPSARQFVTDMEDLHLNIFFKEKEKTINSWKFQPNREEINS